MKGLRFVLSLISIVLLGAGYAGSQYAALNGNSTEWASKTDQEPVVRLSLALFVSALALLFVREREESPQEP